jgi:hypothetical protein
MSQAGWQGFHSQQGQEIFLFSTLFRPALGPTQPPIRCLPEAFSAGVKRPGREDDHSPPSSAEVKNGGAIPPLPIRLHGMVTEKTLPLPITILVHTRFWPENMKVTSWNT